MEGTPCPHVTVEEHVRACVGGTLVGFLLIGLVNAKFIFRFLKSRLSSSKSANSVAQKTNGRRTPKGSANGSEVDQPKEIIEEVAAVIYKMSVLDHLIGAALVAITLINIYTRVTRGVVHWLIQPCHYLTALLIGVTYSSSRNDRLFWVYLYAHWQGYFAFFGGDLSWYVTKTELYAFWLQHILMTVVPFYYLAIGRFNTKHSSLAGFLTIYTLTVIYHSLVLIPVGYWTLTDFDNMLCPFPGAEGLVGIWWREAMAIGSSPFAFLVCYLPGVLAHWFYSSRKNQPGAGPITKPSAPNNKKKRS